jgi:hypothetical protein
MNIALDPQRLETLTDYARGGLGTRAAIAQSLDYLLYPNLPVRTDPKLRALWLDPQR